VADAAGSGVDVIRDARSRVPTLRAIAVGTLADGGLITAAFEAGAAAFLVKTERFDTFGAALRELGPEPVVAKARETAAA
jgi:DNA-binding NarL/FixJ family response regulator